MADINIDSIMKKVDEWPRTPEGKRRMKECIDKYVAKGVNKTKGGSYVLTPQEMEEAAVKLANSIRMAAASYDLPESVMKDIKSLTATKPYQLSDGSWRIDLFFTNDLGRESLYDKKYDGVVNIIALFNNGYLASNTVYGVWKSHMKGILKTSENRKEDLYNRETGLTRSRIARPALLFMQEAVNDFNNTVGKSIGATAVLDDIYEEIPTVAKQ